MTSPVSAREQEVLSAVGLHLTNAEIARELHISIRTVESHVSSLLRKLGAHDRRELVAYAAVAPDSLDEYGETFRGFPHVLTSFVGREAEVLGLKRVMAEHRVVTLVGPGGVGKTRLALEASGGQIGGVASRRAFVNLVPVGPEFVVQSVAAVLGVGARVDDSLERALLDELARTPTLLILDNCEHVLGAVSSFAGSVAADCARTTVLATSRQRLDIDGERVFSLAPMDVERTEGELSDAEALFRARSGDALDLETDDPLVGEICRRLEGVPLAIELAAARCETLGLDGLLAGIDDQLMILTRAGGSGDRHRSLRATIDWSHGLLSEDERAVFRRLAVFSGSFDLVAATAVLGQPRATSGDLLGRLADKSLLVRESRPAGSRWRMLETIHEYARQRLADAGEDQEYRQRHFRWAEAVSRELLAVLDADARWEEEFDAVADDLRAAAAYDHASDDGASYQLLLALGHLTYARRFFAESADHLAAAVTRAPNEAAAVAALRWAASEAFAEMKGERTYELLQLASARSLAAGELRLAAASLADAAVLASRAPALFTEPIPAEEIDRLIARAKELCPGDDSDGEARVALAEAWWESQHYAQPAEAASRRALALAEASADPVLVSSALDAVSTAVLNGGRLKEAAELAARRVTLLDQLPRHDPRAGGEVADTFHMATTTALAAGELGAALASARLHIDEATTSGVPYFAACNLLIVKALQGDFDEATAQAAIMLEGWSRAGSPPAGWMGPAFFAAALAHGLRGDESRCSEWYERAATLRGLRVASGFRPYAEARLALHRGDLDEAVRVARATRLDAGELFKPYACALAAEIATIAGDPDADDLRAVAMPLARENDYALAYLTRASGRRAGDARTLAEAVDIWSRVGAEYELACTMLLIEDRRDEGKVLLANLGCAEPAVL